MAEKTATTSPVNLTARQKHSITRLLLKTYGENAKLSVVQQKTRKGSRNNQVALWLIGRFGEKTTLQRAFAKISKRSRLITTVNYEKTMAVLKFENVSTGDMGKPVVYTVIAQVTGITDIHYVELEGKQTLEVPLTDHYGQVEIFRDGKPYKTLECGMPPIPSVVVTRTEIGGNVLVTIGNAGGEPHGDIKLYQGSYCHWSSRTVPLAADQSHVITLSAFDARFPFPMRVLMAGAEDVSSDVPPPARIEAGPLSWPENESALIVPIKIVDGPVFDTLTLAIFNDQEVELYADTITGPIGERSVLIPAAQVGSGKLRIVVAHLFDQQLDIPVRPSQAPAPTPTPVVYGTQNLRVVSATLSGDGQTFTLRLCNYGPAMTEVLVCMWQKSSDLFYNEKVTLAPEGYLDVPLAMDTLKLHEGEEVLVSAPDQTTLHIPYPVMEEAAPQPMPYSDQEATTAPELVLRTTSLVAGGLRVRIEIVNEANFNMTEAVKVTVRQGASDLLLVNEDHVWLAGQTIPVFCIVSDMQPDLPLNVVVEGFLSVEVPIPTNEAPAEAEPEVTDVPVLTVSALEVLTGGKQIMLTLTNTSQVPMPPKKVTVSQTPDWLTLVEEEHELAPLQSVGLLMEASLVSADQQLHVVVEGLLDVMIPVPTAAPVPVQAPPPIPTESRFFLGPLYFNGLTGQYELPITNNGPAGKYYLWLEGSTHNNHWLTMAEGETILLALNKLVAGERIVIWMIASKMCERVVPQPSGFLFTPYMEAESGKLAVRVKRTDPSMQNTQYMQLATAAMLGIAPHESIMLNEGGEQVIYLDGEAVTGKVASIMSNGTLLFAFKIPALPEVVAEATSEGGD